MKPILENKFYKQYDKVSRYSIFPYYYHRIDDKYIYGITAQLYKGNDVTYLTRVVEIGDTLDTLSLKYYNNPLYYWIIADYNNIKDPYKPLKVGSKLKIPSISNIRYNLT